MKKFTKVCLIAALTLFILGCAFCGIFGTLGGFGQLYNQEKIYSLGWDGLRWSWRWGISGLEFGFLDKDNDFMSSYDGATNIASTSGIEQTKYTSSDFTDIDIELGMVNLVIEESEDDYIWIKNDSSVKTIKYGVEGGVFRLYSRNHNYVYSWNWNDRPQGKVILRLPKGMKLDSVEIETGAGTMEGISLEADTIDLEVGAGEFNIDNLTADVISIDIGAGEMNIDSMTAKTVSISVGAGTLDAKSVDVKDLDLEVGMGDINVQGNITGDMDVDCGMGNVSMKLQGSEKDHNYELDCAMGNVKIGNNNYSGIASERSIDNNSSSDFDIDCATGSIEIEFEN